MNKKRWMHDRYGSKLSPVFADDSDEEDEMSLDDYRRICDLCNEPRKPGKPKLYGGLVTFVNADKIVDLRYLSELALKLFNDAKSTSFKLLKVCKINHGGSGYYGLTFRAQEDGIKESLVFEVLFMCRLGKKRRRCFVRSRMMMMKLHFCPVMMITSVQNEHVKVKIAPLANAKNDL
ncbi:uncharacterized protein [Primulina eburnea]|uniref:uncharacterized protein isoform X5 n=1 Tax=Primulina eburnea TaxID=1245227 RepID=UPI003C6BF2D8